jgi:hypothetical protein
VPPPKDFTPQLVTDGFEAFDAGVNTGVEPRLLKPNELASGINTTVRGGFVTNRPPVRQISLGFGGDSVLTGRFQNGRFQGAEYYEPDEGIESMIASIGGRLFQITPGTNTAKVQEVTISGQTLLTAAFVVPAVGSNVSIQVVSTANIVPNANIQIGTHNYHVFSVDSLTGLTVQNLDDAAGSNVPINTQVSFFDPNPSTRTQAWMWQSEKWMVINDGQSLPMFFDGTGTRRSLGLGGNELPPGRMGAYGLGQSWQSLPDGRTFLMSDEVGDTSSGTAANDFRDAVLKTTQAQLIGNFTVPGNIGKIQAMAFTAILDGSLGQGPLAVVTPDVVFSCLAPMTKAILATVPTGTPILTESQISNGGLGDWSTILVNGDMIYRSEDGIRSLILGRREFATWGNVPISREVNLYLNPDRKDLLNYSSAVYFANRTIMTFSPVFTDHGVYHRGLIALDGDIISSLRGKLPPVYDGAWTGLQVLKLVVGRFSGVERCFAFTLNFEEQIELWELLPDQVAANDNVDDDGAAQIIWQFETPKFFKPKKSTERQFSRLKGGEIYWKDLIGTAHIQVYYRPDDYPCWTLWHEWDECAPENNCQPDPVTGCLPMNNNQPQYFPRRGLPEPDPKVCNQATKMAMREGFTFQMRVVIQGHLKIMGGWVYGETIDQPAFAPLRCTKAGCDTT